MPRATLKKLGLSENEIQVYLTTLSLKHALVSSIANKCGIKRTSTYAVIEKLTEKGFLTSFTKSGTKYYCAIDPEVLLDKCKQQVNNAQSALREMEKIMPILEGLQGSEDKIRVQFFDGFEGLKAMFEDVLIQKSPVLSILSVHDICPKMNEYFSSYYAPKRSPQITNQSKVIFLEHKDAHNYMRKNYDISKFEYITMNPDNFKLDTTIQIYDDKIGFYAIANEKNLHGILIESPMITKTMKTIFSKLWEQNQ